MNKGDVVKRIRLFTLAAMAALALTACIGAASASAASFLAAKYPVTLSGAPTGPHSMNIKNFGAVDCTGSSFSASMANSADPLATSSVADSSCKIFGEAPMKFNGCQLIFHPGDEMAGESIKGSIEIGPAGCGPISIQNATCNKLTIGAQSGLSATYQETTSNGVPAVRVNAQVTNLKYTESGTCGEGTYENGVYTGSWLITGKDAGGSAVGVSISSPSGIYLTGEKSSEEAKQPKFAAEQYPTQIAGIQGPTSHLFTTRTGQIKCSQGGFFGALSAAGPLLSVIPKYEGCTSFGLKATVSMNSCSFVFQVANATPLYKGSMVVYCTKAGDAMEVKAPGCTIKFPSQAGGEGVSYVVNGSGSARTIVAGAELKGIEYIQTGIFCNGEGVFKDGTFTGDTLLRGLR
jgi:hypothetical protein